MYINKGYFTKARSIIDTYEKMLYDFNDKWFELVFHKLSNLYHLCRRDMAQSRIYLKKELLLLDDIAQDSENVFFWGMRAMANIIEGDLVSASRDIEDIEKTIREKKPFLNPHYLSNYHHARFAYHVACLDDAVAEGSRRQVAKNRRFARAACKRSIKNSRKYLPCMTESLRYKGNMYWLMAVAASKGLLDMGRFLAGLKSGRHCKEAVRWWEKSIAEGERLGAKLELSRTYFEIGKRLLEKPLTEKHARLQSKARSLAKKIIGLTPEECLSKAEAMFREMDLQWDLAELAKVRQTQA